MRVSKDAPRMYARGCGATLEYRVHAVDGEDAAITCGPIVTAIPTKYLIKLGAEPKNNTRQEREKQVFKIGDRVRLDKLNGTCQHNGVVGTVCRITSLSANDDNDPSEWYYGIRMNDRTIQSELLLTGKTDVLDGINVCDLVPVECLRPKSQEPKKPGEEIKASDKVLALKTDQITPSYEANTFRRNISQVTNVKDGIASLSGGNHYARTAVEFLGKVEGLSMIDKTARTASDKESEKLDYWEAYTADLAREIVLKTVNSRSQTDSAAKIGEFAVSVAKAVVDNLKKKRV